LPQLLELLPQLLKLLPQLLKLLQQLLELLQQSPSPLQWLSSLLVQVSQRQLLLFELALHELLSLCDLPLLLGQLLLICPMLSLLDLSLTEMLLRLFLAGTLEIPVRSRAFLK
jgi:hypothetical protein